MYDIKIEDRLLLSEQSVELSSVALEKLLERIDGDLAFLAELIDTFLQDAPWLVQNMEQAVKRSDGARLRIAAHNLKANSADFGAMVLFKLCQELERLGKANKLSGAPDLLAKVKVEYEQVETALKAME